MTDEELAAGDQAVREVMATPVGRRWVLKMAGATGAGAALSGIVRVSGGGGVPRHGHRRLACKPAETNASNSTSRSAAPRRTPPNLELRVERGTGGVEPAHCAVSGAAAWPRAALWLKMRRSRQLTHYASVRVPARQRRGDDGPRDAGRAGGDRRAARWHASAGRPAHRRSGRVPTGALLPIGHRHPRNDWTGSGIRADPGVVASMKSPT